MRRVLSALLLIGGVTLAADPVEVAFKARDRNQDGKLTAAELGAPELFRQFDANGDGFVTLAEARAFYSGGRAPGPPLEKQLNVRYARIEGVDPNLLSLDLYRPKGGGKHPVMVMIHGGGWRRGDKAAAAMTRTKVPHFVGAGYVYISINYRLSPAVRHPVHVQDVAKALAWVHDHVAEHGGDPERIFLMGHSSGAHLAALVATDERHLKAHGKSLAILRGVVPLDTAAYDLPALLGGLGARGGAVYRTAFGDDPKGWKLASPLAFVAAGKRIPPFLIFHAGRRVSGAVQSKAFAEALRNAGSPARAVHAPDKDHAGINNCIGDVGDPYTRILMRFLKDPAGAKTR